jgi:hypothetical protein
MSVFVYMFVPVRVPVYASISESVRVLKICSFSFVRCMALKMIPVKKMSSTRSPYEYLSFEPIFDPCKLLLDNTYKETNKMR